MTPVPDPPDATFAVGRHHFRWHERKDAGWCVDCHRSKDDPVHYTQVELDRGIDTDDLQEAVEVARAERAEDSKADLEVYAAELHDALAELWAEVSSQFSSDPARALRVLGTEIGYKVRAVLQADGPARGRPVLEEVSASPKTRTTQRKEHRMSDPRELDPIRHEALFRALEACHINGAADVNAIVANAKLFEDYLAGTAEVEGDG